MESFFAWVLTFSLSFDALIVSSSLGLRTERKNKMKIALFFALTETLMPIAGMIIGGALGQYFKGALSAIGALILIGLAIYFLFFDKDEDHSKEFEQPLANWTLLAVAIGIGMDELTVGFTAGLMQLPILLTIFLIAAQSFLFTMVGVTFGIKLKRYIGDWTEKASGIVLGIMGIWMFIENITLQ
ncbi:manganese efflux pump MntP [Paenibacillus sp. YAF4_2]|uniref:manganese efflux pump MntP n=1 Tax=Paenibacillus sp. YAF4_2 TaxID=3233085 RepID=UPI003F991122